jgi:SulP family sulfate permease
VQAAAESAPPGQGLLLDASQLYALDTTGLEALEQLHRTLQRKGGWLAMAGLHEQPRSLIERSGFARHLHPPP